MLEVHKRERFPLLNASVRFRFGQGTFNSSKRGVWTRKPARSGRTELGAGSARHVPEPDLGEMLLGLPLISAIARPRQVRKLPRCESGGGRGPQSLLQLPLSSFHYSDAGNF